MATIPIGHPGRLDLHDLRVLAALLREHSLTRAAAALDTSQPALSKALARLRRYFDDPLFVRVALRMEPTRKALELEAPLRTMLEAASLLRPRDAGFDPPRSDRTFSLSISDVGTIRLFPPLMQVVVREAPGVRLRAVQLDAQQLRQRLESGEVDLAVGGFPALAQSIRRQRLFAEGYVAVTRRDHPRLGATPSRAAFLGARHVLVSAAGTGHGHQAAERALEAAIPAPNIILRVPGFATAAMVAKYTDAVATLPGKVATALAQALDLALVKPPLELPRLEIALYWHERFHRDPGNRWLRSLIHELFGDGRSASAVRRVPPGPGRSDSSRSRSGHAWRRRPR